jgi:hypothetical protein
MPANIPKPAINKIAATASLMGAYTEARAKMLPKKNRMTAATAPSTTL